jgi:hypothetical protein
MVEQKNILPNINISFGGGLGCMSKKVQAIIQVREEHPEWFYDNIRITSIFDCFPGMIWNGGRPVFGNVSMAEAEERVNFFNQRGIGVNFTFTNCFLKPEHLANPICNQVLKMFENPMNSIIVNSPLLEAHIRKTCPQYKIISSVSKYIYDKEKLRAETAKYDMVVIPPEYNHDWDFLSSLPPEKVELSIAESCQAYCPNRLKHWQYTSKVIIDNSPEEQAIGFPFKCNIKNREMELTILDMISLALAFGINNFKIATRQETTYNYSIHYLVFVKIQALDLFYKAFTTLVPLQPKTLKTI